MTKITVDSAKSTGKVKPMHAVNNGPIAPNVRGVTNFELYKAAGIPYARNHDASFYSSFGGEHTVDVHRIFKNFDADENDPAAYIFDPTDKYVSDTISTGTKVFYRLGASIEHGYKYGTYPPKDFEKWARICEHIIAHYHEGWADGFNYNIKYWEIWNEPDFNDKCWTGTPEEFYDFFAVAAKYLKSRFPSLKIGGPAVCGYNEQWLDSFFEKMREENVPMDFYSWHCYGSKVSDFTSDARRHRAMLDRHGYTDTESILNEWNYVCGWSGDGWKRSLETEASLKGAAFIAAVMSACQREKTDMLMYYDARVNSSMNGLFKRGTLDRLKVYYSVKAWGELLSLQDECALSCDVPDIYSAAATDGETQMLLVTYYTDAAAPLPRTFKVETGEDRLYTIYTLDEEHDMEPFETIASDNGGFTLTMRPNTVVVIK